MERVGLSPGTEVGGYRIVAPLGSGAMGSVYRAVGPDDTQVALKVLHPAVAADPQARARLRREIAVLTKIRNPGVAHVIDAEADAGSDQMFLATELIEGPTLEQEVRTGGPLDLADLAELARTTRAALAAIHAAGIVHRDMKASNVILGDKGPVIIDFGIAQGADDARLTRTGLVMGTPAYLDPELVEGAEPSQVSDWWSWAVTLAYAGTGHEPFGVRPVETVLARARAGTPDLSGLPERVAVALAAALEPHAERRSDPQETVEQLERAARGDVLLTDEERAVVRAQQPAALAPAAVTVPVAAATVPLPAGPAMTAGETRPLPVNQGVGVALEGQGGVPVVGRPPLRRRTASALAIGAVVAALGASRPGVAVVILVALLFVCRLTGVVWTAFYDRREIKGARSGDVVRAWLLAPWHLVRAAVGLIPSLVFAAVACAATVGVAWWFALTGRIELAGAPMGPGFFQLLVAVASVMVALLTWFGPLTLVTRTGGRVLLERLVPHGWPVVVLWVVCAAVVAVLVAVALGSPSLEWAPLPAPPSTAG